MIPYVTYILSFHVHTLLWNSYCAYVIVYFAICDQRVLLVYQNIKINKCVLWSLKLFDNQLFILETHYQIPASCLTFLVNSIKLIK